MRRRLVALALFIACAGACGEPAQAPFDPCAVSWVEGASEAPQTRSFDRSRIWEPGPYHVWSTTSARACGDHAPVRASEDGDTVMQLHFPITNDPAASDEVAVAQGPWPVVVFAHANRDLYEDDGSCISIFERYGSLLRHWASWGYVVASVDNTAQNCRRDGDNLYERSRLQLDALATLGAMNATPGDRLFGHVDTSRVVFAGHSRGGGASLLSANAAPEVVTGVIGLQALDMTRFGAPRLDVPYLGVIAGEDKDLDYPHVEVAEEAMDGAYTMLTVHGGIHAWTSDSVPEKASDEPGLTQHEQQSTTRYYTTALLASVVGLGDGAASPALTPEPMGSILYAHEGARVVEAEALSLAGVSTRWRAPDEDATLIDGFDRADPATNALGGAHEVVSMAAADEVYTFKPDEESPSAGHRRATSLRLTPPQGAPGVWRTTFDPVDAPAGATLQARVKGADGQPAPTFAVVLRGGGQEQRVEVGAEHVGPEAMTNRYTQLVVPIGLGALDEVALEVEGGPLFVDALRVVR